MSREHLELKKNIIIIAIANLGSKGIIFFLAPLYSFFLTTAEYGTMDIISTTISLLFPILCFDIFEATFRYTSDSHYVGKKVLNTSLAVCIPVILICAIVIPISTFASDNNYFFWATSLCVCLSGLNSVLAQYLRGKHKIKLFAFSGVVSAISMLLFTGVFLIFLKRGLEGWTIAYCLSRLVEFTYLILADRNYKDITIRSIETKYLREFIKYSLPLMPTTIMWWIMNMSDRYMIAGMIGISATGIYAVAAKIPSFLSIFENIFYQAWQTTAIKEAEDEHRDIVFSTVFQNYMIVMLVGLMGLLIISKPIVVFLFDTAFHDAWLYLPPLMVGVVVHALSGNLGSLYTVFKNTKGALISSFLGATANITLNFIMIPFMGIMGAALTTLVGYAVTLIYRWKDVKRFVNISINVNGTSIICVIMAIQLILYYFDSNLLFCIRIVLLLAVLLWKRKFLLSIFKI